MFEQAERLQQSIWGRFFIVTVFPLLVVLFISFLFLFYLLILPVLKLAGYLKHGNLDHYVRL